MTTIKRLLRRLDGYTLEAFNAPQSQAGPRRGRHQPAEESLAARRRWASHESSRGRVHPQHGQVGA